MLELIAMFFFYLSYKLDLLSNIYHIQHKESSGNIITALYSFCDLKIKTESWTRITACWRIKFWRTCIKHIFILLEILLADIIMTVQIDIETLRTSFSLLAREGFGFLLICEKAIARKSVEQYNIYTSEYTTWLGTKYIGFPNVIIISTCNLRLILLHQMLFQWIAIH